MVVTAVTANIHQPTVQFERNCPVFTSRANTAAVMYLRFALILVQSKSEVFFVTNQFLKQVFF